MDKFTEAQLAEFKEAFSLFDTNGDGLVDTKEIGVVMRSLAQMPSEEEVEGIKAGIGKKEFDFPEFLAVMSKNMKPLPSENDIKEAFRVFDKEGDGTVSVNELCHVLRNLGEKLTEEEVAEFRKEADETGSGSFNYANFVRTVMEASK